MGTARDIALIFLSLEALVIALVPLAILSALAYGIYRLRLWVKGALTQAQTYAQKAYDYVERASKSVAEPFVRMNSEMRMMTTMINNLTSRRKS